MKTIVQISDTHFGRINYDVIEHLREAVIASKPDLLVVSGDLTQRARSHEFQEARKFLDSLPKPQIVVPGNHDVPLHNIFTRFFSPLKKYKKFITDDLRPFYADEEIAVMGINTARSLTVKGGRINEGQVAAIRERFCGLTDSVLKAVVTHHPFDVPEGFDEGDIVGRSRMAMQFVAECGVDLFLAGHIHIGHMGDTARRYNVGAGPPGADRTGGHRHFDPQPRAYQFVQCDRIRPPRPDHQKAGLAARSKGVCRGRDKSLSSFRPGLAAQRNVLSPLIYLFCVAKREGIICK